MTKSITQPIEAWHFLSNDGRMRFGKRQIVAAGKTYRVRGPLVLCAHGLHASRRAMDALQYAPGAVVCRVRMSGTVIEGNDKLVASTRTVVWMADATDTLRAFARWCALEVAHLWDMPPIVRRHLETGDETIRTAALAAARTAARTAAGDAAGDAAWNAALAAAGDAAWNAARIAARNAALAAARNAARIAARNAARTAAWDVFNAKIETMLLTLAPI